MSLAGRSKQFFFRLRYYALTFVSNPVPSLSTSRGQRVLSSVGSAWILPRLPSGRRTAFRHPSFATCNTFVGAELVYPERSRRAPPLSVSRLAVYWRAFFCGGGVLALFCFFFFLSFSPPP